MSTAVKPTEATFDLNGSTQAWGHVTIPGRLVKNKSTGIKEQRPDQNYFVPNVSTSADMTTIMGGLIALAETKKDGGGVAFFQSLVHNLFKEAYEAVVDTDTGDWDNEKLLAEVVRTERVQGLNLDAYSNELLAELFTVQPWIVLGHDPSPEVTASAADSRERDGVTEDEATRRWASCTAKLAELHRLRSEESEKKAVRADKLATTKRMKAAAAKAAVVTA